MNWQEEQDAIKAAIQEFPKEFGLRAFPGDIFSISESTSYYSQVSGIVLYTARKLENGRWAAFAKGSPSELKRELTLLNK